MTIALSLGFLAMTLGGPALAGDRRNADRGAKNPIVRQRPSLATLPFASRTDVVDRGPSSNVGTPGMDAVLRLLHTLDVRIRF